MNKLHGHPEKMRLSFNHELKRQVVPNLAVNIYWIYILTCERYFKNMYVPRRDLFNFFLFV